MEQAKYLKKFVNDLYSDKAMVLRKLKDYPKYSEKLETIIENSHNENFEIPKDVDTCKELTDFIFWYSLGIDVNSVVKEK